MNMPNPYMMPPQEEENFLSKLNPFNWNIGSWFKGIGAAIAAAFVFNKNPDVAEKVDEYTLGLASKMGGVFGNAVVKVKEIFDVAPTRDQVVDKREVNGVEVATVKPVLANSALALNPENYLILGRLDSVIKELEKQTTSTSDKKNGKSEIDDKRAHATNVARMILEVNRAADESISKNGGNVIINGVDLTIPKVAINIKQPPKNLEKYGSENIGDAWKGLKNNSEDNLRKLKLLEGKIESLSADKPNFKKSALRDDSSGGEISFTDYALIFPRKLARFGDMLFGSTDIGRAAGSDARREIDEKSRIEELVTEKKWSQALEIARSNIGHFDNVGNNKVSEDKESQKYGEARDDFVAIEKFIQAKLMKEELYKYSNGVYKEISRAAVDAKELYEGHNRKAKDFMVVNGAVASVLSTTIAGNPDSADKTEKKAWQGDKPSSVADDRATVAAGKGGGELPASVRAEAQAAVPLSGDGQVIYNNVSKDDGTFGVIPLIVGKGKAPESNKQAANSPNP